MIISSKSTAIVVALFAAGACGLAACDKGPGKTAGSDAPKGQAMNATDKASVAQLQAPPLPDPSRTDPEAVAMRQKYVDWNVAQVKAANDTVQKQTEQFDSRDAPKGNYGHMADGLPQLGGHK